MSTGIDPYHDTIKTLKNLEKTIHDNLKELRGQIEKNVNTFNIENTTRKNIDKHLLTINKLSEEYTKKSTSVISSLPEKEFMRRLNEVQDLKTLNNQLKSTYEGFLDSKYKPVSMSHIILRQTNLITLPIMKMII